jgi:hypothetical protein
MKTLSAEMVERLKVNAIPLIGSTRVMKFGFSNTTQIAGWLQRIENQHNGHNYIISGG